MPFPLLRDLDVLLRFPVEVVKIIIETLSTETPELYYCSLWVFSK